MRDEMFFTSDMRSLRRGKRIAARTETCRPCVIWPADARDVELHGVVMDVSPFGMLIRMLDSIPPGTEIVIQLMRDDDFREPLAKPLEGKVVRNHGEFGGFRDHGVQLVQKDVKRPESKPVRLEKRRPLRYPKSRMHTIDVIVGGHPRRRGHWR
jgi:hypothetical protein